VLRQQVRVLIDLDDAKELRDYPTEELTFKPRKKKGQKKNTAEEKEIAALEE